MVVIIKACSVCRPIVREALVKAGVPHTETKNKARNTSSFTIQAPSPNTYTPSSLAALCWKALRFPFHQIEKEEKFYSRRLRTGTLLLVPMLRVRDEWVDVEHGGEVDGICVVVMDETD
ncbi:predicted protein [Chaetomium globosum CBS 148.51]|uniref:Uncharacterized protein n=1 Tax=Chaetomium globosum (strain ATCC 6205 / CBS 148.51 / DSM 1962 / NBRC 6347 / NRRL 1970) TaxID=306901 RepID=Q2GQ90_CHAGB|nr:uncharacterized protein CHGG_09864 [Chaetomium globosum CBS 148.51]EAQ83460.1 predicted protein [Chaetomium globosum CBS 148.51]